MYLGYFPHKWRVLILLNRASDASYKNVRIYKYRIIWKPCFYVFVLTVDQIYHLASPASPPNYMYNPIKTLKTNTIGTLNMLGECTQSQLLSRDLNLNVFFVLFFLVTFSKPLCVFQGLAKRVGARLLLASTSEVYGGKRDFAQSSLSVFFPPPDNHIEFSHQSGCCLMCSFGNLISTGTIVFFSLWVSP